MKPLSNFLLIEPLEAEGRTAGGLHIPEAAKQRPQRGLVLAVGPGQFQNGIRVPTEIQEGQTILYGKFAGSEVIQEGKTLLLIRDSEALAIL